MFNLKILNDLLLLDEDNVPDLGVDTLHIWSIFLNQPDDLIPDLSKLLSEKEIEKVERFRFPHLKRRYIVFHATLRKILARYLGFDEADIIYMHGDYGKPAVAEHINPLNLQFSMSRSSETGLYAFMLNNEVGVDIEQIKPLSDMESIVKSNFSENEKHIFEGLDSKEKTEWFYTVWTRKEALLKALGFGLYISPEDVDVSDRYNVKIENDLYDRDNIGSELMLDDLILVPGFSSALCKVRTRIDTDYTDNFFQRF